jgi:putative hydrolase of the HAD superfamily
MLHSIFLDAAGTLIKTRESVGQVYAAHADRHGADIDPEATQKHFLLTFRATPPAQGDERAWWQTLVTTVLRKSGATDIDFDTCFAQLFDHYATADAWELYPDVIPFLEQCQAKLGIISNFDQRLYSILNGLDLTRHFHSITISNEIGVSKPDPKIFQTALTKHDSAPQNALHIGDDPIADWKGAEDYGIQVFRLSRPKNTLLDASTENFPQ